MDRREFIKGLGVGAAALTFTGCRSLIADNKPVGRKPNIVFIMADDLGYRELGCYGQEKIKTPHIDKLAKEGMKFTDWYAGSAVCAPCRCILMTGMHAGHAFVRSNKEILGKVPFLGQVPLPEETVTIAEVLKSRGYATGAFGKWGLGGVDTSGDPLNQGFDRFYGYNCQRHAHNYYPRFLVDDKKRQMLEGNDRKQTGKQYAPQLIADEMLKFVRENKEKPFFVYYPTVIPHLALQAPQEEIEEYKGKWPETPYKGKQYQKHPTPKACYAAMISFMDKQVGRLMELLKELKLDDNTIVFFTSDNGTTYLKNQVDYEFFNSVGSLRGFKASLYEGGIRVPMVVRWPGKVKAGSVSNLPGVHYDIPATLADLTDAKSLKGTDGFSVMPTLLSKSGQKKHEYLFWEFAGYGGQLAVRMGKWKGVKKDIKKNPDAKLELYNLEDDISESKNVVKEYPEVAAKIEKIMLDAREKPVTKRFIFGKYRE